jgi:hypothetical protein
MNGLKATFAMFVLSYTLSASAALPVKHEARMGEFGIGEDCDGTCGNVISGFSGVAATKKYVEVASLGGVGSIGELSLEDNDIICRKAIKGDPRIFISIVEKDTSLTEKLNCKLDVEDRNSDRNHFLHAVATQRKAPGTFTKSLIRSLLKNKKEHLIVGLVLGVDGEQDLFDEIKSVHATRASSPKNQKELDEMKRTLCAMIRIKKITKLYELRARKCNG